VGQLLDCMSAHRLCNQMTGPRDLSTEAWEEDRIRHNELEICGSEAGSFDCTPSTGTPSAVPSNTTLSTIPSSPAPSRPHLSKRRDSFSFLFMTISFAGLGIMSLQRSMAHWSDIMHGNGEIRSIFFALLLFVFAVVLGECPDVLLCYNLFYKLSY